MSPVAKLKNNILCCIFWRPKNQLFAPGSPVFGPIDPQRVWVSLYGGPTLYVSKATHLFGWGSFWKNWLHIWTLHKILVYNYVQHYFWWRLISTWLYSQTCYFWWGFHFSRQTNYNNWKKISNTGYIYITTVDAYK